MAEQFFKNLRLKTVDTTSHSIEEISSRIVKELKVRIPRLAHSVNRP